MSKIIVCMDHSESAIAGCMYEIQQNGKVVASGQTDGDGRAKITQEISSSAKTRIFFWPPERKCESAYETDTFYWTESLEELGLTAPKEYTIPLRRTDNVAGEDANYMQKWHKVEQGDTLYGIANRYGTSVSAVKERNNLQTDQINIGQKLLLPNNSTRPTPNSSPEPPQETKKDSDPIADIINQLPSKSEEESPADTPVASEEKQAEPQPTKTTSQDQVKQDRSAQTEKPESVVKVQNNKCWCNRDFTLDELKSIIGKMREIEGIKQKTLFYDKSCPLPSKDKTYERLLEEINRVCRVYDINTCFRKAHFLCQTYWEAARMATTLEFATGNAYNPSQRQDAKANGNTVEGDGPRYRGRGLMQLTWRKNYSRYFSFLCKNNPQVFSKFDIPNGKSSADQLLNRTAILNEPKSQSKFKEFIPVDYAGLVANDLFFAVDSAAWFWVYGVLLKNGDALSLNTLADAGDEKQQRISTLVNGGGNGRKERNGYYYALKDTVMEIPKRCINYRK